MDSEQNIEKIEADKKMWRTARWGVIIICVVHMFVSLIAQGATGAESNTARFTGLPILFNFWFASWYIKDRIAKGKAEENLMLMGIKVAAVVFLIQVVLGAILISILMK
jgi:hypothetical protein